MMNIIETDCETLNLDPHILVEAENGDAIAQVTLGRIYYNAVYSESNTFHAFKWISCSAEQGNMEAQFLLANLYALGQGTKQSHADAYKWYTRAALQGYKKALIRIHNLYHQDKKIHCRGKLNSQEELRIDYKAYTTTYYHRELNEQRLEDSKLVLSNTLTYYTIQFQKYKSFNYEDLDNHLNLAFIYHHGYGVRKNTILAIDFYKKAAEKGHRDAQYHLAVLYQDNTHIKFNYRTALRWYRTSATNGNIAAQNNLGYFYEKGLYIQLNYEGALYWYTKAADAGNSNAQLNLARLYRKGQGVEQSLLEATKWYRLAALQGNKAAQNCLIQLLQRRQLNIVLESELFSKPALFSKLQSDINKLHYSPNIKHLKKIAQHALMTDGNAMYTLGLKYCNGDNFPQDKDVGFQWIKKAAKAGAQQAEFMIAKMYENGNGVEQDYHESSIWTTKLVKKKNDKAQNNLGILYKNGFGVRKDPLEASKWFIKSADQGNADAIYQFGLLKFDGEGVRKDKDEAFKYFYRSALLRKPDALFRLGCMYENGDSVGVDKNQAIRMYTTAAKLGYKHGQFTLGRIYEQGVLVKKDLIEALKYYTMAAKSGDPSYKIDLGIKYLNGVFDDPDYTKAYHLLNHTAEKDSFTKGIIFQKSNTHFTKIHDIFNIFKMLVSAAERDVEDIAFDIGYAYECGIDYRQTKKYHPKHKDSVMKYYHFWNDASVKTMSMENWQKIKDSNDRRAIEWYNNGIEGLLHNDEEVFSTRIKKIERHYSNAIMWYLKATNRNDSRAQYRLGAMYEEGKGVDKDIAKAFSYYSQAYENGNSDAAFGLASMYFNGNGVSQDLIKAFYLFTEASYAGHIGASEMLTPSIIRGNLEMLETIGALGHVALQYQLGIFYEKENPLKSFKWLTLAAHGGITDAYYKLGLFYEKYRSTDMDHLKSVNLYEKAGRKDHPDALYRLAQLYHHGQYIECNYLKAYDFYTRAAKLEHKGAQNVLNIAGRSTIDFDENNQKSTSDVSPSEMEDSLLLLRSVAKHGNADLQYSLGTFYSSSGKNQNYKEAFMWYEMATDNGHVESIYHLGLLYEKGLGVEQDYIKSFELYNRAKAQGSHYALHQLGIAFHHGYGVDRNTEKALACYIKAAELGNHESQHTLGILYIQGELVQKDTIKALVWFTKAYQNDNQHAIENLHDLYADQPYEQYFYKKLFQTLSKLEKSYKSKINDNSKADGSIQFKLGKMYFYGLGTTKNYVTALSNFITAYYDYDYKKAKQFLPLQYNNQNIVLKSNYMEMLQAYSLMTDKLKDIDLYELGVLYEDGAKIYFIDQNTSNISGPLAIVPKNETLALRYFKLAAEKGFSRAQNQLGHMYLNMNSAKQDYDEAIKWFNMHAESVSSSDCYEQAMEYNESIEMEKNIDVSLIYLKKAAEKNYAQAQAQLTLISIQDDGVKQDSKDAIKEIQDMIKSMDPDDCYDVGMKLYNDNKINKNYDISLICMQEAAKENHSQAQTQLGVMYLHGNGVEKNFNKAKEWIEKSINDIDLEECYVQGMSFYRSIEIDRNYEIALVCLQKAAENHHAKAQAQIGIMYLQGYGVKKNPHKAIRYIDQSLVEMDQYECYDQGIKFYSGLEVDKNYEVSLKYLRKAAMKKHGVAQAQIGLMYLQGNGVKKNIGEAMSWIKQSTKEMNDEERYQHGMKFCTGIEVDRDYEISLIYLISAAERGYSMAQAQLGVMYLQGNGVKKNYDKAMEWFKKSIDNMEWVDYYRQGMKFYRATELDKNYEISLLYLKESAKKDDPYSQAQLAYMYSKGIGMDEDHEQASRWRSRIKSGYPKHDEFSLSQIYHYDEDGIQDFSKALECYQKELYTDSREYALRGIGLLYEYGDGINQDYQTAMKYYKQSANEQNVGAYYNIGLLYYYGRGVDQSYVDALSWFLKILENKPNDYETHLFIQDVNGLSILGGHIDSKYSIQPGSTIYGAAHYYLGLIYKNGYGTAKNHEKSQGHFKKASEHGIDRANDFISSPFPFPVNILVVFLHKVYTFFIFYLSRCFNK